MRWRVATLEARSPSEALRGLVDAEDWDAATALARRFERVGVLHADDVAKARWRRRFPARTRSATRSRGCRDRAWVAAACASAVAPTYEAQRSVLLRGLRETERWFSARRKRETAETDARGIAAGRDPSPESAETASLDRADASGDRERDRRSTAGGDPPRWAAAGSSRPAGSADVSVSTPPRGDEASDPSASDPSDAFSDARSVRWWTALRLTLLAFLDRLDCLRAIRLGAPVAGAQYASFRTATFREAAARFCDAGDVRAAETVARRHPRSTCADGGLLRALEALPETTRAASWASLAPWASPWRDEEAPSDRFRNSRGAARTAPDDVAETSEAVATLREGLQDSENDPPPGVSADALREMRFFADCLGGPEASRAWLLLESTEAVRALATPWRPAAASEPGGALGWARRFAARCDRDAGAVGVAAEVLTAAHEHAGALGCSPAEAEALGEEARTRRGARGGGVPRARPGPARGVARDV